MWTICPLCNLENFLLFWAIWAHLLFSFLFHFSFFLAIVISKRPHTCLIVVLIVVCGFNRGHTWRVCPYSDSMMTGDCTLGHCSDIPLSCGVKYSHATGCVQELVHFDTIHELLLDVGASWTPFGICGRHQQLNSYSHAYMAGILPSLWFSCFLYFHIFMAHSYVNSQRDRIQNCGSHQRRSTSPQKSH